MTTREYRASLRRDMQECSYCAQFKTYHEEETEMNEEPPVTAELARVLELDAKATQGPWELSHYDFETIALRCDLRRFARGL